MMEFCCFSGKDVGLYYWLNIDGIKPLWKLFECKALVEMEVANACALQVCEIGSAVEGYAYVACQSPYVSAFAAYHAYGQHGLFIAYCFYFVNGQRFRFQLDFLPVSRQIKGSYAFYFACRVGWWCLLYCADKTFQHSVDALPCDVFCGVNCIFGMFHVKTWCSGSEFECGNILLGVTLQFFDSFCCLACAE